MKKSRIEMRASLVGARGSHVLVRVHRKVEEGFTDGYVVDVGQEWFALCHVADQVIYNGFQVFRLKDVSAVEAPAPNVTFVERALRLRGEVGPRNPEIDLGEIAAVRTASAAYPLVAVHRDVVEPGGGHIGAVERLAGATVVLRLISADGEWEEERESLRLEDITRVDFGGHYEEALSLVASTS
jgi:hypothetical protein